MIGSLNGVLVSKTPPWLTLECQGVGFEMEAPMSTFYALGEEGSRVLLYTALLFREDGFHLFGFSRKEEKNFFKILLKAGGIGPKLSLAIMSAFDIQEFYGIIAQKQSSLLTQVPGIGKKTAERLVLNCKTSCQKTAPCLMQKKNAPKRYMPWDTSRKKSWLFYHKSQKAPLRRKFA